MTQEGKLESLVAVEPDVPRETFELLLRLEEELLRWNARINLVGPATEKQIWQRHILDSAQLLPLARDKTRWLDLGSGGGFPGLVVAAFLKHKGGQIDLVESNRKKAGFLQAMIGTLNLPAKVHAERIERVSVFDVDIVSARALAPLPLLLTLSSPWLSSGSSGLFHKGRDYAEEVAESSRSWAFDLVEHRSVIDPASVILDIGNLRPR